MDWPIITIIKLTSFIVNKIVANSMNYVYVFLCFNIKTDYSFGFFVGIKQRQNNAPVRFEPAISVFVDSCLADGSPKQLYTWKLVHLYFNSSSANTTKSYRGMWTEKRTLNSSKYLGDIWVVKHM